MPGRIGPRPPCMRPATPDGGCWPGRPRMAPAFGSYCTRRGVGVPRCTCGMGTPGRPSQTSMPVLAAAGRVAGTGAADGAGEVGADEANAFSGGASVGAGVNGGGVGATSMTGVIGAATAGTDAATGDERGAGGGGSTLAVAAATACDGRSSGGALGAGGGSTGATSTTGSGAAAGRDSGAGGAETGGVYGREGRTT